MSRAVARFCPSLGTENPKPAIAAAFRWRYRLTKPKNRLVCSCQPRTLEACLQDHRGEQESGKGVDARSCLRPGQDRVIAGYTARSFKVICDDLDVRGETSHVLALAPSFRPDLIFPAQLARFLSNAARSGRGRDGQKTTKPKRFSLTGNARIYRKVRPEARETGPKKFEGCLIDRDPRRTLQANVFLQLGNNLCDELSACAANSACSCDQRFVDMEVTAIDPHCRFRELSSAMHQPLVEAD